MATTSDELWRFPGQHEYDGIVYCSAMKPGALDRIKKLQLHPQDILISNYPKAGKPLSVSINALSIKQFAWITQYRKLYGLIKCWLIVNFMVIIFSSFFLFSKKLPIVVVRDVCPSVRPSVRLSVCGNNFFSR